MQRDRYWFLQGPARRRQSGLHRRRRRDKRPTHDIHCRLFARSAFANHVVFDIFFFLVCVIVRPSLRPLSLSLNLDNCQGTLHCRAGGAPSADWAATVARRGRCSVCVCSRSSRLCACPSYRVPVFASCMALWLLFARTSHLAGTAWQRLRCSVRVGLATVALRLLCALVAEPGSRHTRRRRAKCTA